ncbi:MAG: RdgB/HAM1 family non-canonical purine NTP pyrophosphatase [Herpetosiphonaceae bacterium]|nr:RdgB/HAM1 family non-canonical purine NTP pyrophosphatase [Herpetosiphonaceae bacterium]
MLDTLLIGSNNAHKVEELQAIFAGLPLRLITLHEAGIDHEVDETGTTFEENARLKADTYAAISGLPTLADDSGLEVAALKSAPGIYTARWALPDLDNPHRSYARVLEELKGKPFHDRIARFVCVIALARPGAETVVVEGVLPGIIAEEPRGVGGFGYDPVFYLLDYDQHMAELPAEEKNRISHRAQAAAQARTIIEGWVRGSGQ